jgi:hypothetical protein
MCGGYFIYKVIRTISLSYVYTNGTGTSNSELGNRYCYNTIPTFCEQRLNGNKCLKKKGWRKGLSFNFSIDSSLIILQQGTLPKFTTQEQSQLLCSFKIYYIKKALK